MKTTMVILLAGLILSVTGCATGNYLRFPSEPESGKSHITIRPNERYLGSVLTHDGKVSGTDLSLRKMLHHLQVKARIAQTGNSWIVEADPRAQSAAGSSDW